MPIRLPSGMERRDNFPNGKQTSRERNFSYLIGDCARACGGSLVAGILLYRLAFAYAHTRFVRDGIGYYIASRSELMRDTGLGRHQYDRAIKLLRESQFIETTVAGAIGSNKPLRTTAFIVTDKAYGLVLLAKRTR